MSDKFKNYVEQFLFERQGYLKSSPLKVAEVIWSKNPSNRTDSQQLKELSIIKQVHSSLKQAKLLETQALKNSYNTIQKAKALPPKILFFDIETSPNLLLSWRIGNKVKLTHDSIVSERAIICICWKWAGETKVHSLKWLKGDDKSILEQFAKVIDSADIIIGQNSDNFDIKWLRTRCAFHSIPFTPKFNSIDTLKIAKNGFYFNSNKLDYLGKFFNLGGKLDTGGFNSWREIVLNNNTVALNKLVKYCKKDVQLLEDVYNKLKPYIPEKTFRPKL